MNYVENIYVCLAAPIFIAILAVGRNPRRAMTFILGGMTVCLLSSYISTFLAGVSGADAEAAAINISPIVEEIMKFLPVFFYMVVFEPEEKGKAVGALLMIAIGFATFENICFLTIIRLIINYFWGCYIKNFIIRYISFFSKCIYPLLFYFLLMDYDYSSIR